MIKQPSIGEHRHNLHTHPELYESVTLNDYDFELLRQALVALPAAHECVIGAGFLDWRRVPKERIHPLHHELLETFNGRKTIVELVGDADQDHQTYDNDAPLYYR
ncbi:MAG: hypothetical protein ABL962_09875 [Fimbriimonadaceae bacterium]